MKLYGKYIKNIVLKNFSGLKKSSIKSAIFSIDGLVLDVSKQVLNKQNFNLDIFTYECIENILDILEIGQNNSSVSELINLSKKLITITAKDKIILNCIILVPIQNKIESLLVQFIPILYPNGECIAVQVFSSEYRIFHVIEYLKYLPKYCFQPLSIIGKSHDLPIKLSTRQHEILFWLSNFDSQNEIATRLNITRGTVARIIAEIICPKFGIYPADSDILIEKSRALNYHRYLPSSLCEVCVIGLTPLVIDNYFNGQSRFYPSRNY